MTSLPKRTTDIRTLTQLPGWKSEATKKTVLYLQATRGRPLRLQKTSGPIEVSGTSEQFPDVFKGSVSHFRTQLKLSRLTEGVWNVSKSREQRPDRRYVLQTRVFVRKQKNEGKTQTLPSVWPLKGQGQSSLTCFTLTWNAALTESQTTENPGSAHQLTTLFYAVGALNIMKRLIQSAACSLEPNWLLELMNDTTLSSLQGNEWARLPKISASESKHTDFY